MSKRVLSQTPSAVAARERRLFASVDKAEAKWNAEVLAYMKTHGVDFDTAFVACGGTIISDREFAEIALVAKIKRALDSFEQTKRANG